MIIKKNKMLYQGGFPFYKNYICPAYYIFRYIAIFIISLVVIIGTIMIIVVIYNGHQQQKKEKEKKE
ncbi:hypothetical protein BCR32DRAFT_151694 [Anaeromyces robustus]|uniref:Uncharacterized protein n=1 Tax=Anaeromyces robustus TaxID=1754192 RepID=A0A1Y1XC51_9FUNG|nr:hypothetical protein BCR32DRAFT_151694 [Anaeromyces robustus]|eukprot:ORX83297.1 hypothetical protein BCR32DRAFT_151694 [Anaeromyces robustus]